jgi:geranylgeranyl pyrophosphate synthase/predicted secreted hydrolase
MFSYPDDWPTNDPIDLTLHDPPHASSTLEWWYVNAHVQTRRYPNLSLFASFFRLATHRDEQTGLPVYAHAVTWSIIDRDRRQYITVSELDQRAPDIVLHKLAQGVMSEDTLIHRALRSMLEQKRVLAPDRLFTEPVQVDRERLNLTFGRNRFWKEPDGSYHLILDAPEKELCCDLRWRPRKAPIRNGIDGLASKAHAEVMFYYSISRCDVSGTITWHGDTEPVFRGIGWYDHEFGCPLVDDTKSTIHTSKQNKAWTWLSALLDDGTDVTAALVIDTATGSVCEQCAIVVDPDSTRHQYTDITLEEHGEWFSTRTLCVYPTLWTLDIAAANLHLDIVAAFPEQEFLTALSLPAFWEGAVYIAGQHNGQTLQGVGIVERSGYDTSLDLQTLLQAVGTETQRSVQAILPLEPRFEQARDLIASEARAHYMHGVTLDRLSTALIRPVREIVDRGGKNWRSYAILACVDIVGGHSQAFMRWLALPELVHVGSLIVDDIHDQSRMRRGGPAAHLRYGEALASNAGTACYFIGPGLMHSERISAEDHVRLYKLYFEALRAGHAGQALDIQGLTDVLPTVVETGDSQALEAQVLAIHRLKSAAPVSAVARMGAIAGGGTDAQVEGLGRFFEALGQAFQIMDDVLNIRGFENNLKHRGEDLVEGKVTLPVAKALGYVPHTQRQALAQVLTTAPCDPMQIAAAIEMIETCGALDACVTDAYTMIETAWQELDPLIEDSLPKVILRAFSWYILERHY